MTTISRGSVALIIQTPAESGQPRPVVDLHAGSLITRLTREDLEALAQLAPLALHALENS